MMYGYWVKAPEAIANPGVFKFHREGIFFDQESRGFVIVEAKKSLNDVKKGMYDVLDGNFVGKTFFVKESRGADAYRQLNRQRSVEKARMALKLQEMRRASSFR